MENNRNNYSFDGFINNEEKSIEESNLELLTNNYLKLNTNITREIDNKEDIKIQNPNDHLEKELERHDWSELVPEEARKSIALTIDGKGEEVIETTPPIIVNHSEIDDTIVIPQSPNYNNAEKDKEYLKKLQSLLTTYTDYQKQLKDLGKSNIEEVIKEAKQLGLFNYVQTDTEQVDNFDTSKLM